MLDSSSDTPEEKLLVWCRQSVRGWDIIYDLCYLFLQGFWYFAQLRSCEIHVNLRNAAKFTKTREIPWNSLEIISKYMSVRHIWNLSQLLGLFTSCKLANLSWNFVTETSKQSPKTCSHWWSWWCHKKLGTSHDVKSFAVGSFLDGIVVERANDYLC